MWVVALCVCVCQADLDAALDRITELNADKASLREQVRRGEVSCVLLVGPVGLLGCEGGGACLVCHQPEWAIPTLPLPSLSSPYCPGPLATL